MVLFAIMVLYVKIKLIYSSSTYRFKSNLDRSLPIVNLFCFCMILPGKFFPRKYLYFRLPLIKCLFHSKRINFASNKFLLYLIDNSDSSVYVFVLMKFIHNIFHCWNSFTISSIIWLTFQTNLQLNLHEIRLLQFVWFTTTHPRKNQRVKKRRTSGRRFEKIGRGKNPRNKKNQAERG
jgi:hypothetical protein